jgi:uncharacterized protein YukE
VGRRLITEGDRVAETGLDLKRAMSGLDTWAWDGKSRRQAEPLLSRVGPASEAISQDLESLGRTLVHAADVFEQRDLTAARNFDGMSWVEFALPAGAGAGIIAASAGRRMVKHMELGIGSWEKDKVFGESSFTIDDDDSTLKTKQEIGLGSRNLGASFHVKGRATDHEKDGGIGVGLWLGGSYAGVWIGLSDNWKRFWPAWDEGPVLQVGPYNLGLNIKPAGWIKDGAKKVGGKIKGGLKKLKFW